MSQSPIDIPMTAPNLEPHLPETHVRALITPDDAKLAYDILVPKTWGVSKEFGPVQRTLLQAEGIGFFMASGDPGAPVIAVTVTRCPFEVPLDGWLRSSLALEGWTLLQSHWFPGPAGLFFEATAVRVVDDRELVRRTSVRVDHGRIFAVNCMCARDSWDAVKETFWVAHVSFELQAPARDASMEQWRRSVASQPDFEFAHPASWSAERADSGTHDISGAHVRLIDPGGEVLLAYLLVRGARRQADVEPAMAPLVQEACGMLEKSGVTLTAAPEPQSEADDPRAAAVEGWLGGVTAPGKLGDAEIVVRLGFVVRKAVVFTLASFSPKPEDDMLVALRTQRAFEIVRSTLRTLEA
jgi:hypothetical protein